MRPNTLFLTAGVLALLFGLGFLLAPTVLLPVYGAPTDAPTVLMSRFFAVALVHLGCVLYLLRDVREAAVQRGLALAGVVGSLAGLAVAVTAVLGGVINSVGWSTVAIYALLLLGYANCLRGRSAMSER